MPKFVVIFQEKVHDNAATKVLQGVLQRDPARRPQHSQPAQAGAQLLRVWTTPHEAFAPRGRPYRRFSEVCAKRILPSKAPSSCESIGAVPQNVYSIYRRVCIIF